MRIRPQDECVYAEARSGHLTITVVLRTPTEAQGFARMAAWIGVEQGFSPCYSKDMAKVTSKLQVTVPKAVADRYGIRPGDEIEWLVSGDIIRVVPPGKQIKTMSPAERLRRFDLATARQRKRNKRPQAASGQNRGWSREDLYRRGRAR